MKKRDLTVVLVLAAAAAALLIGTVGQTAEKDDDEEEQVLGAVMRIDAGPLLRKLDKLEAELLLLRTVNQQLGKKMEAIQESLGKMEKVIAGLEKPEKWQYHLLYNISNTAVNRFGEQGWELVTAGTNYIVFRRPAPETKEE